MKLPTALDQQPEQWQYLLAPDHPLTALVLHFMEIGTPPQVLPYPREDLGSCG